MLKNYIRIAFRSLWRQKGYSFINIAGLAVGLACALFILLWVQDELSYDRFHSNAGTLYRVEQDQEGGQGKFHVNVTPYPMGPALKAEIPEIKETVRYTSPGTLLVRYEDKVFFESRVRAVDPQILQMFTFPLNRGDEASALSRPGSLVLTEEAARKYFGEADPLGKTVTVNNAHAFTVTGVLKKIPRNSTLAFDMLVPFDFVKTLGQYDDSMGNNSILTFVQLHAANQAAAAGEKISQLVRNRNIAAVRADPEEMKRIENDPEARKRFENYRGPTFSVLPLVDLRLYAYFGFNRNDMGIRTVKTFGAIALFVLLIACINFMNLATARSANRAREVGLRKVVGADRKSLVARFYGESFLTAVLAGLIALGLVILLRPAFNTLAGKMIPLAAVLSGRFLGGILAVTLLAGFVAGSYPAVFLSSFRPAHVLKSGVRSVRGAFFRKTLVVLQFSLSILLIIGMGVVSRQVEFMRNKNLGYEKEQLVYLPLRGDTPAAYAALKESLLRNPRVLGVTATHQPPTSIGSNSWGMDWDGKDPAERYLVGFGFVDFDYPETMKIEMAAGRSFSREFAADNGKAFMVNEEVPKLMKLDAASAVGKRLRWGGIEGPIVGVMKNFHYQSVHNAIEPLAVAVLPSDFRYAVVRLKAGEIPASLEDVKNAWSRIYPQYPVDYRFFDQDFDEMYRSDERVGALLRVFAGLTVIIACLGLFGLASFMAEQRTREIGVRKVLGASASGIAVLFSREFAAWVLAANALAWPVAYLVMKNWLQTFAYRSPLPWWLFAAAGAGALIIAMATVSFQAFRVSRTDPAVALKYE